MTRERAQRIGIALLLALPAFLAFNFVYRFGVNVIGGDDWELVPLFDRWFAGTVSFSELFAQHNEHRFLFPRIVMLLSASAVHYNTHALMYLSWLFVLGIAAVLLAEHVSTFGASPVSLIVWVPVAWLLFSARQYENWLWGWQVGFFMCAAAFVSAAYLVHTSDKGVWRFPAGLLCAVISSYTVGGGLGVWPAGAAQLLALHLIRRDNASRRYLVMLTTWCLVGAVAVGFYVRGLKSNPAHPDPAYVLHHPLEGLRFFIATLGAPFSHRVDGAVAAGTALCVVAVIIVVAWTRGAIDRARAAFAIPFFVYSLAFAALITVGRGGWGPELGLSSRYTTLLAFFAIGVHRAALAITWERTRLVLAGVLLCLTISCLSAFFQESYTFAFASKDYQRTNAEILRDWRNRSDDELRRLYPVPAVVRERAPLLERYHLGVFAP